MRPRIGKVTSRKTCRPWVRSPADADALPEGKVWPAMFDKLESEPVTSPHALLMTIARCRVSNWYRDTAVSAKN